ncbi:MAG: MFS transporter [Deltaproteobacteria bacterium]|nr:MFS transporter [Candidatus Zymogenaceae bacterium]
MKRQVETFPLWGKLLYSSGVVGYTIADRIWVTFMFYFYLPPAESGMRELIPNVTFWGIFTAVGLVTVFGRIVDSVADPLVASWSDRSKSRLGRRRSLMIFGGLPLMAAAVFLFFPPFSEPGIGNTIFLAVMLGVLLFSFTVYVVPLLALIPELTHSNKERINLVTIQAVLSLLGIIIVMIGGYILWDIIGGMGLSKTTSLQATVVCLGILGLIFCYIAVIPIDEKRYSKSTPTEVGLFESLRLTLRSGAFLSYLFGTITFWFGLNIVSMGAAYYVRVLLNKDEAFASVVFGAVFGVALVFFPIINLAGRYIAKKTIMVISLLIFGLASCALYWLGTDALVIPVAYQPFVIFAILGIPVSALLLIPNAMISDIAEYDSIQTKTNREAMFFGAQGLLQKINLGISALIFAFLLSSYGKDVAQPMGVRLSGPVVAAVCIIGIVMFLLYPEKKIMGALEAKRSAGEKG